MVGLGGERSCVGEIWEYPSHHIKLFGLPQNTDAMQTMVKVKTHKTSNGDVSSMRTRLLPWTSRVSNSLHTPHTPISKNSRPSSYSSGSSNSSSFNSLGSCASWYCMQSST